jgi:hypothetical protein
VAETGPAGVEARASIKRHNLLSAKQLDEGEPTLRAGSHADCWSGISSVLPTSGGLDNISWQLPADVSPAGARPFDFCLKDLRPILAP